MDRVGNVPTSVVCRPKGDYVKRDMRRWAKRYGIPFQPNPAMREADMTRLPRAAIAADRIGAADTAVAALFAALWREPAPLAPREDIFAILKGAGIDPAALGDIAETDLARELRGESDAGAKSTGERPV